MLVGSVEVGTAMTTKHVLEARIRERRTVLLVVNTHSRRGERLFQAALDELVRRGLSRWLPGCVPAAKRR